MSDLFLKIFNIAVAAGWIVPVALVLRWILGRRLPGWVRVALWGVVGARLLFPFSLESVLSLIPSAETLPPAITTAPAPQVNVGVPVVDQVINPVISQTMAPAPQASVNPMEVLVTVASVMWLVGVVGMLIYYAVCAIRLRRRLAVSLPQGEGVFICDNLPTPILVGVLRPRIYIPSGTDPAFYPHILAHEGNHLKRGDHIWKPLGFLLLSIYWFHPLLWVAYALLGRDMEQACDEKTVKNMTGGELQAYVKALVACNNRTPSHNMPSPVGFGETKIFERVKHMLSYKKPKVWMSVIAVALIAATAVCFLTNPVSAKEPDEPITPPNTQETTGTEQPTEEVTTAPEAEDPILKRDMEIKQAYVRHYNIEDECPLEWLSIRYYGTFNGAHVMFVDGYYEHTMAECGEMVGGIMFPYTDGQKLEVCYKGVLYSLPEAYSAGILSDNHILEILNIHLINFPGLKPAPEEVRADLISEFGVIPGEVVEEMEQNYVRQFKRKPDKSTPLEFQLYGVFDNAYAVLPVPRDLVFFLGETKETAGDYEFVYRTSEQLKIYCDGVYYSVADAYANGILSIDDVRILYENSKGGDAVLP